MNKWGVYEKESERHEIHIAPIDEEHEMEFHSCACGYQIEVLENDSILVIHESFNDV